MSFRVSCSKILTIPPLKTIGLTFQLLLCSSYFLLSTVTTTVTKQTGYVFFGFSYYRSNDAVKEDNELQAFVNELAINGPGPDGGNGKVMKLLQPL